MYGSTNTENAELRNAIIEHFKNAPVKERTADRKREENGEVRQMHRAEALPADARGQIVFKHPKHNDPSLNRSLRFKDSTSPARRQGNGEEKD